jgi:hypothetical protein
MGWNMATLLEFMIWSTLGLVFFLGLRFNANNTKWASRRRLERLERLIGPDKILKREAVLPNEKRVP